MNSGYFNYIYCKYVNLIYHIAFRIVQDYHLAQDICQEVFLKLYRRMNVLDEARIKGWLIVVAETTAIDFQRQRNRLRECLHEEVLAEAFLQVSDPEMLFHKAEVQEFGQRLFCELYHKNTGWYETVVGLDVAGFSAQEMAQRLEVSLTNLRVRYHRARIWMKHKFEMDYLNLFKS